MPRRRKLVIGMLFVGLAAALGIRHALGRSFDRVVSLGQYPSSMAVDAAFGRAFVINGGDNTISMLETRSGAVLRTIPAGLGPSALAIDERTQHVFVLDAYDANDTGTDPPLLHWLRSWLPHLPHPTPHIGDSVRILEVSG